MRICRFQNIGLNMCAHAGAFCKHIKHCCKTSIFYTPTVKSCYFMNISPKELHVWPLMAQKRFSAFTEQNKSWKPDIHTLIKHAFLTAITCVSNQLLQCLSNGQADTRKQTCFDQMLFVQLCRKYFVCSKQQEKTYYQHSSCVIIYLWWTCKQSTKYIDCFLSTISYAYGRLFWVQYHFLGDSKVNFKLWQRNLFMLMSKIRSYWNEK